MAIVITVFSFIEFFLIDYSYFYLFLIYRYFTIIFLSKYGELLYTVVTDTTVLRRKMESRYPTVYSL